jgi:hypothetical protein
MNELTIEQWPFVLIYIIFILIIVYLLSKRLDKFVIGSMKELKEDNFRYLLFTILLTSLIITLFTLTYILNNTFPRENYWNNLSFINIVIMYISSFIVSLPSIWGMALFLCLPRFFLFSLKEEFFRKKEEIIYG